MSSALHIPASRVRLVDAAQLEARARALERSAEPGGESQERALVCFQLGAARCAAELSAVSKAQARLGEVLPVAGRRGALRGVAFVENTPVAVADLAGLAHPEPRSLRALAAGPALLVQRDARWVALCVEGRLDLIEEEVAASASVGAEQGIQFGGVTASGALVVSSAWLRRWVAEL
jgi:chemotaxis signal transduction protein